MLTVIETNSFRLVDSFSILNRAKLAAFQVDGFHFWCRIKILVLWKNWDENKYSHISSWGMFGIFECYWLNDGRTLITFTFILRPTRIRISKMIHLNFRSTFHKKFFKVVKEHRGINETVNNINYKRLSFTAHRVFAYAIRENLCSGTNVRWVIHLIVKVFDNYWVHIFS